MERRNAWTTYNAEELKNSMRLMRIIRNVWTQEKQSVNVLRLQLKEQRQQATRISKALLKAAKRCRQEIRSMQYAWTRVYLYVPDW